AARASVPRWAVTSIRRLARPFGSIHTMANSPSCLRVHPLGTAARQPAGDRYQVSRSADGPVGDGTGEGLTAGRLLSATTVGVASLDHGHASTQPAAAATTTVPAVIPAMAAILRVRPARRGGAGAGWAGSSAASNRSASCGSRRFLGSRASSPFTTGRRGTVTSSWERAAGSGGVAEAGGGGGGGRGAGARGGVGGGGGGRGGGGGGAGGGGDGGGDGGGGRGVQRGPWAQPGQTGSSSFEGGLTASAKLI